IMEQKRTLIHGDHILAALLSDATTEALEVGHRPRRDETIEQRRSRHVECVTRKRKQHPRRREVVGQPHRLSSSGAKRRPSSSGAKRLGSAVITLYEKQQILRFAEDDIGGVDDGMSFTP